MDTRPLSDIANPEARLEELVFRLGQASEPRARGLLLSALGDPWPTLRHTAARELGHHMTPALGRVLCQIVAQACALDAPLVAELHALAEVEGLEPAAASAALQNSAVIALEAWKAPEAVEALMGAMDSTDADLRFHALSALSEQALSEEEALALVVRALGDGDGAVVAAGAHLAAERGLFAALPQLWTTFGQWTAAGRAGQGRARPEPLQVRSLAFALAGLEGHAARVGPGGASGLGDAPGSAESGQLARLVAICVEALQDEATLAEAARALGALGREEAVAPLQKVIGRWFAHPLLRLGAAAALMELGDPEGFAYLNKALESRRKDVRGHALELVGRLELVDLEPHVARVAQSRDYHADTAVLALSTLGTPSARTVLESIAEKHPDQDMRALAREQLQAWHTRPSPPMASES